ncbi:MqnA/MqnD/SBP family protein [Arcobacter peruensis]|uniref:MqnA/MqnD/SBP family protein n=1 Tax=Arcobacter peruensis TaxID=2320140 RepID=UPI000F08B6FA|nr:MqnA/MqnD/SBP family protein [Arcobacter peruensis]
MVFAKIDFINLLPFHVYIKKHIRSTQTKAIIEYKKSYPSAINKKFKKRKVDSAFISSIASRHEKKLNLGIVAKKDVLSVLLIPGKDEKDFQSDTSNALAKVLNLKGKVIIGDKALKFYHQDKDKKFIDLAEEWNKKYNLPFVFAVLCYSSHKKQLEKITKNFNKNHIKIPTYILNQYSKRTGISNKNILEYLKKIDYKIGIKEKRSLKLFLKLTK